MRQNPHVVTHTRIATEGNASMRLLMAQMKGVRESSSNTNPTRHKIAYHKKTNRCSDVSVDVGIDAWDAVHREK